jgi:hypothetical protein
MQAAAGAALEKNSQMGSELGALVSGDMNQDIKTEIDMEIKNLVENNITTNNLTSTVSEQVNIQNGELNVKRYDCTVGNATLDFSQDVVSEIKAESVMSTLKESISNNTMLNKMAATADASATQKQGGIAEVMDSVLGGIAGIIGTSQQGAMAASGASVCIVCVLVIGMAVMFMSPAGQNMGRTAMKKF